MLEVLFASLLVLGGMVALIYALFVVCAIIYAISRHAYQLTATGIKRTVERRREIQRVGGSLSMPGEDTQGAVSVQNERGTVHVVETPE